MTPQLTFGVTPLALTRGSRFTLDIDGGRFEFFFGPEREHMAAWPGLRPGSASVTIEATPRPAPIVTDGRWAWQRLIDASVVRRETDTRYLLTWTSGDASATVRIEAPSIVNPFNGLELQNFQCR